MAERRRHVVFGAGQIGPHLARQLQAAGHDVLIVRRTTSSGRAGFPIEIGDAGDPAFAARVTKGAAVIYHCMNPVYDTQVWRRELPRLMQSLIGAAGASGARLVVLDNLYMLGRTHGRPMNEETPVNPAGPKGEIRARVAEMLFDAHRCGAVRAVAGRASDFYGPGARQSMFGDRFWPDVLRGKPVQLPVRLDTPHTWHYTPDVASGLATLGEAPEDVLGRAWMLPAEPPGTTRAFVGLVSEALGKPIAIQRVPPFLLTLLGLFMPILRELREAIGQWEEPFVVDDRRFRERFGGRSTPMTEGVCETVTWAKAAYATHAARRP